MIKHIFVRPSDGNDENDGSTWELARKTTPPECGVQPLYPVVVHIEGKGDVSDSNLP